MVMPCPNHIYCTNASLVLLSAIQVSTIAEFTVHIMATDRWIGRNKMNKCRDADRERYRKRDTKGDRDRDGHGHGDSYSRCIDGKDIDAD